MFINRCIIVYARKSHMFSVAQDKLERLKGREYPQLSDLGVLERLSNEVWRILVLRENAR